MPNPILPGWEYIPDGEPRVFGDRVYLYGSHDKAASDRFCDHKLKVWSAPLSDLGKWSCHGDSFHTRADEEHPADADWSDNELYAPDVVEKDGKYYLYAYILGAKGCVAVSDRPEGPFSLLGKYEYNIENHRDDGIFVDPGVLVDDDGRVYVYCGFLSSHMAEIDGNDMRTVLDDTYMEDIIPVEAPHEFFEACSPRKVGDKYYMIYSPKIGSRLVYAVSDSPRGPFVYQGIIIDNGADYPGGNDHGSICCINGQWYIFYHRMTNGTIMSRRACVERIELRPDGSIPQVEMTSLGFDEALSPYAPTPAEIACVLKNGCFVTEYNAFTRAVTGIREGAVMGYKYFEFGEDFSSKTMIFAVNTRGTGCNAKLHILLDSEDGEEIGVLDIGTDGGAISTRVRCVTGRHAVFFKVSVELDPAFRTMFDGRDLFELISFVFMK